MKTAILGTAPLSKHLAPFDDPEWNIWVCSAGNRAGGVPTPQGRTTWFELHGIVDLKGKENAAWGPDYFAWLRTQSFPIYMQEPNDLVPQSITFPRDVLLEKFGRLPFTSSIAWMIGYAVHLGVEEIGIFGVDMAATEEHYGAQKFGCLRMCEIASERGIKITIPLESCLGQMPPLYGYAEATRMGRRLLEQERVVNESVEQLTATIARLQGELHFHRGALDQIRYMRRTFVDGMDAELDLPATESGAKGLTVTDKPAVEVHSPQVYETSPGGVIMPTVKDAGRNARRNRNGAAAHPE